MGQPVDHVAPTPEAEVPLAVLGGDDQAGAGDVDVVDEEAGEMQTLFLLEGVIQYLDDDDNVVYQDDVFTKLERYLNYCRDHGITYKEIEAAGFFFPVVGAHAKYIRHAFVVIAEHVDDGLG